MAIVLQTMNHRTLNVQIRGANHATRDEPARMYPVFTD
jgi:hypothetical protein